MQKQMLNRHTTTQETLGVLSVQKQMLNRHTTTQETGCEEDFFLVLTSKGWNCVCVCVHVSRVCVRARARERESCVW